MQYAEMAETKRNRNITRKIKTKHNLSTKVKYQGRRCKRQFPLQIKLLTVNEGESRTNNTGGDGFHRGFLSLLGACNSGNLWIENPTASY